MAQTSPITPSGLNTQINLSATPPAGKVQYDITGGTRLGVGSNLFHSFGEFGVPTNNIANFLNETGLPTSNILGRVTDGNISNIYGTIQTTGFGTANLFLMNPAGFLFGPNATVHVGGMVAFTSADYLRLADGVLFNATSNAAADALLSAAPVAAFGFLGSNPAAIAVHGSKLAVQPGQSISLVGGNEGFTYTNPDTGSTASVLNGVTVTGGQILAPGGQVNVASVASPGEILVGTLAQAPNINGQSFGSLGTIQISQQSVIDVSGDGGGTVLIRGGRFVIDDSTISVNVTGPGPITNGVESIGGGIDIQVSQDAVIHNFAVLETNVVGNATPDVQYGSVHVEAEHIEIAGVLDFELFPFTGIRSDVHTGSTGGQSGNIELEANSILGKDLGQIETLTEGAGDAGNIRLTATRDIDLNTVSIQSSSVDAAGNAGDIDLISTSGNISMTTFTLVTSQASFSNGHAGAITVSAPLGDILLADQVSVFNQAFNAGPIGGIEFSAKNLQLNGESFISGDNLTTLTPGNITVTVSNSLSLDGKSGIQTVARGPAAAADLTIRAHDVSIADDSFLTTETFVSGPGGQLNIATENLQLISGGKLKSGSTIGMDESGPTIPSGAGGTITIQGLSGSAQSMLIDGADSGIFTNAEGTGAGGSIFVNANSVTLQNGGTLSAATSGTTPTATGGTITVNAGQAQLNSGGLITAATTGPGNAGSVTINADDSVTIDGQVSFAAPPLSARSRIITSTSGSGNGGDVTIMAGQSVSITGNQSGIFTNTNGTGDAGNIDINADTLTLNSVAQVRANTLPGSEGRGGNIDVQVRQATLTESSSILTNTVGLGDAGSIRVRADESIALVDSAINSSSFDSGNGAGNAGLIWLTAPMITLQHGNLISLSFGPGDAGDILLGARVLTVGASEDGPESTISAETSGPGRGGDITVRGLNGSSSRAGDVSISEGSAVTSSTSGEGRAGDIDVLTERMTLTDGSVMLTTSGAGGIAGNIKIDAGESVQISSFGLLESSALDIGNAGHITVITPTVTVNDGGLISTSTLASGNAGTITINAMSVSLLNGGQLTSSTLNFDPGSPEFAPTGNAGNVTIEGPQSPAQSVLIDGPGSGIFTDTQGTGAGGNIFVDANSVALQNGGTLSAKTSGTEAAATGGSITVTTTNQVTMTGGTSITASSTGPADAGNIHINAGSQFAMTNSSVTTQSNLASGGTIKITTTPNGTVELTDSTISASVLDGTGGGGSVNIDPQFVILQNSQILAQAKQGPGGNISITTNLLLPDANSVISASSEFGVNGTVTIQSPNAPGSGQVQPLGKTPLQATTLLNQHCASLAGGEFSSFTVAGRDSLPTEPGSWLASPLATLNAGMGLGVKAERVRPVVRDEEPEGETVWLSLRQIAPVGFLTQAFALDWSTGCHS